VDVTAEKYYADPILDRATPEILKKQLADGTYDLDSRMRRAFTEIVNKGTNNTHAQTDWTLRDDDRGRNCPA